MERDGTPRSYSMQISNFRDMYLAELQELASAEQQVAALMARVGEVVTHPDLKKAMQRLLHDAEAQKQKLHAILETHRADPQAHTDQAMQALAAELGKMLRILKPSELTDAGVIASAQKLVHYQIAAYGTASALAGQLGLREDQQTLHACLEEEKAADRELSELAKGGINRRAQAA
jgi:ferritin-like metal-binding protein YciE